MNGRCCAAVSSLKGVRTSQSPHPGTLRRRFRAFCKWIVPGGILVLLPKCPMCIAAYVALGTGIGISVSTATYLRIGLVTLCGIALLYLTANYFRHRTTRFGWRQRTILH